MVAAAIPVTTDFGVVLNRQARAALASITLSDPPRFFVVGPAGSGKSTLLHLGARALQEAGRTVRFLDADTDPDTVPARDILFADDLQGLGPEQRSAVLVRASSAGAGLVVAMRPWPRPDHATDIARCLDREAPPVVLGHVARSDVLAHLDEAGLVLDDACLSNILELTGGVTWLVAHALAAHDARDCAHDPGHSTLQQVVEAQVAHRLDTLDTPLRRAIEHLGVAPEESMLPLLSSPLASDMIERGHAEGLLLRNGGTVPVVRAAARSAMPAHRLQEFGAPLTSEDLTLRQALGAWSTGDLAGAAAGLESLGPGASPGNRRTATSLAVAVWSARGMMGTASDVCLAGPPGADSGAAAVAALAHIGAGRADRLRSPEPGGSPGGPDAAGPSTALISMQLLERGLRASLDADQPARALTDLVRAAELHRSASADDPLPELPSVVAASVALGYGHLTTAEQVIHAAIASAPRTCWSRRRLLLWQAWLAMNAERPADARAAFEAAEQIPGVVSPRDTFLMESVRVGMARRYDTLAALEAVWRDSLERVRHIDVDLYSALPLTTLVTAAARVGDAATLAGQLEHTFEILDALGSPPTWATHVWWAGVQQGILLNEPDMLAPHARGLVGAASSNPLAAVMARAGGVWMSVLGGTVDVDAVEAAGRDLAAVGLAWDGARLAGHGSRRTEDRREVARLLAVARELHPRESAARVDDRKGGPSAAATGGVLSEREWDVATLVLEGKTYNEVGATIFISPKTVEHHVAHIRRRLGATSRSDLMAKLRVLIEDSRDASP